jgi:hypothetical protein
MPMPRVLEPRAAAIAFAVLFVFYQLPEGLGMRVLGSFPVLAGLMLFYHAVAFFVGRRLGGRGYDAYAMHLHPGAMRNLASLLVLAFLVKLGALFVGEKLGVYVLARPAEPAVFPAAISAIALAMLSTFVPSVAEDILTRGLLFRASPGSWAAGKFVLFSSLVYVLNHIYRLAEGPLEWTRLFCFGLAYAAALYRSGSLWAAIGLHWGWNLAGQTIPMFLDAKDQGHIGGPLVSAGAHLVLLAVVALVPGAVARDPAADPRVAEA